MDRTADGVAHVEAENWAGAGFGQGLAHAQDRLPTLLDQVVKVRGERARWLGPGAGGANVASDAFYRLLALREPPRAEDPDVDAVTDGYVAGVNRHLEEAAGRLESHAAVLADAVGRVERADLDLIARDLCILAGSRSLVQAIAGDDRWTGRPATAGLSNAWAVGRDRSASGNALLLGNPHFPWTGELRFWEAHLTVPGVVDVYGGALTGVPGIAAGFNRRVAWSFTRSTTRTMVFYRLTLVPGEPARYVYGDDVRELAPVTFDVEVRQPDGTTAPVARTLWLSHHGPVLRGSEPGSAVAVRDAGLEAPSFTALWLALDRAGSVEEVADAVGRYGTFGATVVAADADGRVWFGDGSWTPSLTEAAIRSLGHAVPWDVVLDGSDPGHKWTELHGAPAPGLLPFDRQPSVTGTGVVLNCNDSYWLADPDAPLTGFSPIQGSTGVPQGARTRLSARLLREGPKPTLEDLQRLVLDNVSLHALQNRERVVRATRASGRLDVAAVLERWDGRFDLESRGALLWREVLAALRPRMQDQPAAFDPDRPIETPAGLAGDPDAVVDAIADAVEALARRGIPIDACLGDFQYDGRPGGGAPVHGGLGEDSVLNVNADFTGMDSTLETVPAERRPGYPVTFGASFLHAVELTPEGPVARGLLVYGQADDPGDPGRTRDLERFARKEWRPLHFEADDVAAHRTESRILNDGTR